MTVRRVARERGAAAESTPRGVEGIIRRRAGRNALAETSPAATPEVAEYFGFGEDTLALELLKSVAPVSQRHRDGTHVHVSDVVSKCLRKFAIMKKLDLRHPSETIRDGQGITFAIGDALHDYVKERFTVGHPDKVWANWTCRCPAKTSFIGVFSAAASAGACLECGGPLSKHNEVPVHDGEYSLVGNPDLVFWLEEYKAYFINEIKSISADGWKDITRPQPNHVVQVTFYWYLMKKAGYRVLDRVSILYVNKEYSFKFPYKEFMFEPSMELLAPYLEDLDALKVALAGGDLPPRTMCGTINAPEAKKCAVCTSCFALG